jgi:2-C-methyl-D-erythritol 4-phosphate cytidylyltransferase
MGGAVAIILAGGAGERVGADVPKAFLELGGRSILSLAVSAATGSPAIGQALAVVPDGYEDRARESGLGPLVVVPGGATRRASVRAALQALDDSGDQAEVVVCHDAARPFASPDLFTAVVRGIEDGVDGVIPVVLIPDTVKRVREGRVVTTERREELALAQTPQAFRRIALRSAHERAADEDLEFTDDAALVEWTGGIVRVVPGEPENFKITTRADLQLARAMVEDRSR